MQSARRWPGRVLVLLCTVLLIAAAVWVLYRTDVGAAIRRKELVRHWMAAQPAIAPLLFVMAYGLVGTLALPVWWLQIIAGYCFGVAMGLLWCHLGAVVSSVIAVRLTSWMADGLPWGSLVRHRDRLAGFNERLGHNGLLVVTAVRICHVMPFGISNYLFGLTRIRLRDVIVGTILGGTLSKMIHIAVGADPHLLISARFLVILIGVNLALVAPLICYLLFVIGYSPAARTGGQITTNK